MTSCGSSTPPSVSASTCPYRDYDPRPVVGTQGLIAVAWHRSYEQYAGTQMQHRFERFAKRIMTERDYSAWIAVRRSARR